jgi:hypothetical protein
VQTRVAVDTDPSGVRNNSLVDALQANLSGALIGLSIMLLAGVAALMMAAVLILVTVVVAHA